MGTLAPEAAGAEPPSVGKEPYGVTPGSRSRLAAPLAVNLICPASTAQPLPTRIRSHPPQSRATGACPCQTRPGTNWGHGLRPTTITGAQDTLPDGLASSASTPVGHLAKRGIGHLASGEITHVADASIGCLWYTGIWQTDPVPATMNLTHGHRRSHQRWSLDDRLAPFGVWLRQRPGK